MPTTKRRQRPPFIISTADVAETAERYPNSEEVVSYGRPIGKSAGLLRMGLHVQRVPPGHRTSYPHAEQNEEEFVYVLEGEVDAWIDGELYRMKPGDLAAFPAGTGISHTFLNNGAQDAVLFVGGEASKRDSKIYYPLNPTRKSDLDWSQWWADVPKRPLGKHDGLPDARRAHDRRRVQKRSKGVPGAAPTPASRIRRRAPGSSEPRMARPLPPHRPVGEDNV